MILDSLSNAMHYSSIHPGLEAAFRHLSDNAMKDLDVGRHEIDGKRIFAIVTKSPGKGKKGAHLETHNRYIDLQLTLSGFDLIGWESKALCTPDEKGYNPESDVQFYSNVPDSWFSVSADKFAVFFPKDAHAPMGTEEFVHKVVIKVSLEW
jgi:YhcH/YjgK/YiaL family protein